MVRTVVAAVSVLLAAADGRPAPAPLTGPPATAGARAGSVPVPVQYRLPLPAPVRVLRPFTPPASRYGPGHLGVDLQATQGATVRTAAPGVVTFAGPVAGRGLVVVLHADGLRTEYEPLQPAVGRGDHLGAASVLGIVRGRHPGCSGGCLHWGARRGDHYLDPLRLLAPLGPVRLLPWSTP